MDGKRRYRASLIGKRTISHHRERAGQKRKPIPERKQRSKSARERDESGPKRKEFSREKIVSHRLSHHPLRLRIGNLQVSDALPRAKGRPRLVLPPRKLNPPNIRLGWTPYTREQASLKRVRAVEMRTRWLEEVIRKRKGGSSVSLKSCRCSLSRTCEGESCLIKFLVSGRRPYRGDNPKLIRLG